MPDSLITKGARFVTKGTDEDPVPDEDKRRRHMRKCGMNRKSFYYHFCDKYDLVNWIFDTEFSEIRNRPDHIANLEDICEYFIPTASSTAVRSR